MTSAMSTAQRPIAHDELLVALRDLPPLPSVVLELVESLGHEELSAAQYAAKNSRDQALAAKTLRLANSSFYGRGRQVHSVAEAISVLGLRTVRGVVTDAGLASSFRHHPGFDHHAFWRQSIGTALYAQAQAAELRRDDADLAFTVGLLHDIGRLALATAFAPDYAEVDRWRRGQDSPGLEAERAALGIDHAEVGGLIARQWNFAPAIVDVIRFHHERPHEPPHAAPHVTGVTLTGIAHVADAMAHALGLAWPATPTKRCWRWRWPRWCWASSTGRCASATIGCRRQVARGRQRERALGDPARRTLLETLPGQALDAPAQPAYLAHQRGGLRIGRGADELVLAAARHQLLGQTVEGVRGPQGPHPAGLGRCIPDDRQPSERCLGLDAAQRQAIEGRRIKQQGLHAAGLQVLDTRLHDTGLCVVRAGLPPPQHGVVR